MEKDVGGGGGGKLWGLLVEPVGICGVIHTSAGTAINGETNDGSFPLSSCLSCCPSCCVGTVGGACRDMCGITH